MTIDWYELGKYLELVEVIREELKRDPVWLPESCPVEGCEHVEGVA